MSSASWPMMRCTASSLTSCADSPSGLSAETARCSAFSNSSFDRLDVSNPCSTIDTSTLRLPPLGGHARALLRCESFFLIESFFAARAAAATAFDAPCGHERPVLAAAFFGHDRPVVAATLFEGVAAEPAAETDPSPTAAGAAGVAGAARHELQLREQRTVIHS